MSHTTQIMHNEVAKKALKIKFNMIYYFNEQAKLQ